MYVESLSQVYKASFEVWISFQRSLLLNTCAYSFLNSSDVTTLWTTSSISLADGQMSLK